MTIMHTALAGACMLAAAAAQAQPVSAPVSQAERLLFETDHFRRIVAPATLTYAFRKVSEIEPGFEDDVRLDVTRAAGSGKPAVAVRFLSGSRQRETPGVENALGNPALLGFLERDIAEMKRLTGGATHYFRKRIRLALAGEAQVTARTFTYAGRQVAGREVRIAPYRNDPLRERFGKYADKNYVFLVSDKVPGGLYQLRTSLSGTAAPGAPLMDETLTLARVEHGKP